jgi:large subunit ribosomal protein L14e
MFEVGRVCVKTAGREAGRYCIVVTKAKENLVLVSGPKSLTGVRRRKCNIDHLEPIMEKVKISADASDAEVAKAFDSAGLHEKLKIRKLTKDELAALEAAKEDKAKKKEERKKAEEERKAKEAAEKKRAEEEAKRKAEKEAAEKAKRRAEEEKKAAKAKDKKAPAKPAEKPKEEAKPEKKAEEPRKDEAKTEEKK